MYFKMRKNAKIRLIEMDEDRDMKDGIQTQIAKTNLVIVNQSTEDVWIGTPNP